MAAIDDRAAALNRRLARDEEPDQAPPDDEPDEPVDEGPGGADADENEDQGDEPDDGQQPARAPAPDAGSGTVAGIILGLVLYSVVMQYVRGGTARVRGWLKAKAINQPMSAQDVAGTGNPLPNSTSTTPKNAPKGASL